LTNADNKSNNRIELLTGDPKKAIRKLSFTVTLTMILALSYLIIDSIWVAGLGFNALAALGFISPLVMVIFGLGSGLGTGATSLIARCIGANDKGKANNAGLHSVLLTLIVSILLPLISLLFLKDILVLIGAVSVLTLANDYGQIIFLGSFALLFNSLGSSILRAEGDMNRATYAIAISSILNIVIAPLFIYTLKLGISGAAIATILSSIVSCIIILYWILIKKDTYISFKLENFHFNMGIIKDILLVTLPASVEFFIMSITTIVINAMLIIVAGTTAVAVYTVGWRIVSLGITPAMGIETALLIIGGVAFGAKNYKKLELSFNYSIKLAVLISLVLAILTYIFAPSITWLFTYSSNSAILAPKIMEFIRIFCIYFIALPLGLASSSVFQAMGKGSTSLVLIIIRDLILSLIVAYILGFVLHLGANGIYWGIVIGIILGSAISYLYFRIFLKRLKKDAINLNIN
jgi:putative MATE family efflux protein